MFIFWILLLLFKKHKFNVDKNKNYQGNHMNQLSNISDGVYSDIDDEEFLQLIQNQQMTKVIISSNKNKKYSYEFFYTKFKLFLFF